MKTGLMLLIPIVLALPAAAQVVSVAANGWQIAADPEHTSLEIRQDRLGTLLKDVRLGLRGEQGFARAGAWSAGQLSPNVLRIRTAQPESTWLFQLDPEMLIISSTSTDASLTGTAPAAPERIVARLMDSAGTPVVWSGTGEVANGYGGALTQNPSFLPQQNPEVMYFSLGQVSGTRFHALFDRKTDTAITFSELTTLERPADLNTLRVNIPVPGNSAIRVLPDYYTKTLGVPYYVPFNDQSFPTAPMVWSSWTSYYAEVTERDMVRNADWLAEHLKPYGFQYVQLDDGYDRGDKGQHYWIENWDRKKFPHGPGWLTSYIKGKGFKAGIWLVPNAYAGGVKEHPDWYLRDKAGNLLLDYETPTLDSTNPQVLQFLRKLFGTLDGWGFEYYKFDGEHAFSKYVPAVDRSKLHDPAMDPLVAYRDRLKIIRDVVGPGTFIEGCPAGTPLNGIGYFDSYFNGDDVYNSWPGMYPLFSAISGNAFLNHLLVYVMPAEGMELGSFLKASEAKRKRNATFAEVAKTREAKPEGFGTTSPEARTLVSQVALSGVVYSLSSVLPELPAERLQLLKMTLPTVPIYPVDLFSRGTDMTWDKFKHVTPDEYIHNYPEILDLKVNQKSGTYDVVAITNWRSTTARREVSFDRTLGISSNGSYLVFDFWNQKFLGVFSDKLPVTVEPHDTRVLFVHPASGQPALIGISRHITGSYSILDRNWDASTGTFSGVSQGVAGEPYSLTFYVPSGMHVAGVKANGEDGKDIAEKHAADGQAFTLEFAGQAKPVRWQVRFASTTAQ